MEKEKILNRINEFNDWFHKIEIEPNVITPGRDNSFLKFKNLNLDEHFFKNKSVLDIGARDGYFSFMAEKCGASKVIAMDIVPVNKTGFNIAKELLNSKVEYIHADFLNFDFSLLGKFDIVLFLGVLYHLRHPLLALDKIYEICNETIILESLVIDPLGFIKPDRKKIKMKKKLLDVPLMQFYRTNELDNDITTWIGPNICCVKEMMLNAGFQPTLVNQIDKRASLIGKKIPINEKNKLTSIELNA